MITERELSKALKFREKRWAEEYPELGTDPLPLAPYISKDQFELEREHIFRKTWLNVGRVEDISNNGDFFVKDLAVCKTSVIVTRGKDDKIRAFHNMCSHRGNPVAWDEKGTCPKGFTCRFHGFSYDLEGRLVGVPDEQMFFDLDKSKLGLTPITTDVWNGFIFINLDPKPKETLLEYLGEVGQRLMGHRFDETLSYYGYRAKEIKCNWKIIIYGFLEAWHVLFLHKQSAGDIFGSPENPFSHNLLIKLYDRHRLISLYGNPDFRPMAVGTIANRFGTSVMQTDASPDQLPEDTNPTKSPCWSFDLNNIFPNFQLNVVNNAWYMHRFWPLDVDRTLWETRMYFPEAKNAGERFSQEYSKITTRDVLLEDASVLERLQKVMASGAKAEINLQDEEIAIRHFNKVVEDHVLNRVAS